MRWFRFYDEALDDFEVQRLPAREFARQFRAALNGETNAFSRFIRPDSGRPDSNEWAAVRTLVFKRDDYTCQYCGARGVKLECDHVLPVKHGGRHDPSNLATACFSCNRSKQDYLLEEWRPRALGQD